MSDRRQHARCQTFLSVQIDGPNKLGRIGITHNLSATGMLLATASGFQEGQRLSLTINHKTGHRRRVLGRVTRMTERWANAFPRRLAISFERDLS
jgi:hypothetical protein